MEIGNKGYIRVVQVSGGKGHLYGSKVTHQYYINLEIGESKGGDTMDPFDYQHSNKRAAISIDMSLLQFAQMITSIGKGEGVACTIRRFNGKKTEPYEIPDQQESLKKYGDSIEERSNTELRAVRDKLKEKMAEGKRPTKAEMEEMIKLLEMADSDRNNLNFIGEQTQKIFEKAVVDAKHQIEAHAMHLLGSAEQSPHFISAKPAQPAIEDHNDETVGD